MNHCCSTEVDLLLEVVEADLGNLLAAANRLGGEDRNNLLQKLVSVCETLRQGPNTICSQDEAPSSSCPIPAEVIRQVCSSEYLTIREQGRWLLLVSKSIGQSLGNHQLWKLLCCRQWQNSSLVPSCVLERRGYEWLFKQRIVSSHLDHYQISAPMMRPQRLDPPTISIDKLVLLISIFNSKEQETVSIALSGNELESLLQTGEMNISLLDPVLLGPHTIRKNGIIEFDMFCTDFFDWKATMHLLRTDRSQCAIVHDTVNTSWGEYDYCEDSSASATGPTAKMTLPLSGLDLAELKETARKKNKKAETVEVDMGYLEFSTDPLDLDFVGQAYFERLRQGEAFRSDVLDNVKIEPSLLCYTRDFDQSKQSVELAFSELRLDIWMTYRSGAAKLFNSRQAADREHGVTLLHLLDHLSGWDEKRRQNTNTGLSS